MKKLISDNFCLEFTKLLKKRPLESCALVLLVCFLLGDKFEKNFAALGSVGSIFIGYAAYRISKEQQRATEQKISEEERRIVRQNYENFIDGISKIYNNYSDISEIIKGAEILRQVANQAKLELPKDLEDYAQKAYEVAQKISLKVRKCFDHERSQKPNSDLVDYNGAYDEISQFLSPITLYSKYLKTLKTNLNK